ncbi:MAG: hypothetical protein ABH805_00515 [Candidatus Nealsonbacteria bacterium]
MTILPALTTITKSAWRNKIEEIEKLKLKEIALFPTCLNLKERQELYSFLEKTKVSRIPFVHLRSDMDLGEIEYLVQRYGTQLFNTHTERQHPMLYDYGKYKKIIFIENIYLPFDEQEIKEFGGVCVDLSHLENDRLQHEDIYKKNVEIIEKYPIGCSHFSAVKKETHVNEENQIRYDNHYLDDLKEMDYLKRYPLKYFGSFSAVELENKIEEQLKIKEYVIKIKKA